MRFINNSDYPLCIEYDKKYILNVGCIIDITFVDEFNECRVNLDVKDNIIFNLFPFSRVTSIIDDQIRLSIYFNCKIICENIYEVVFENCNSSLSDSIVLRSVCSKYCSSVQYYKPNVKKNLIIKYKLIKILFTDFLPIGVLGFILAVLNSNIVMFGFSFFIIIRAIINVIKRKKDIDLLLTDKCNGLLNEKAKLLNEIDYCNDSKIFKNIISKWINKMK